MTFPERVSVDPEGDHFRNQDAVQKECCEQRRSIRSGINDHQIALAIACSSLPIPESKTRLGTVDPRGPRPEFSKDSDMLAYNATIVPPPSLSSFKTVSQSGTRANVRRVNGRLGIVSERLKATGNSISSSIGRYNLDPKTPTLYQMMLQTSRTLKSHRSDVNETDSQSSGAGQEPIGHAILDMLPKPPDFNKPQDNKRRHCQFWFPHGTFWTLGIIVLSIGSLVLSILTIKSMEFAHLRYPLPVSSDFIGVDSVGLLKLQLCSNSTEVTIQQADSVCQTIVMTTEQAHDRNWIFARTVACLAVAFGFFLTTVITSSICWATINFKPIAIAYFLVYVLQSLTFFFFASDLCRNHVCSFGSGAVYSMTATVFWMIICFVSIRMDVVYFRKLRRRGATSPQRTNSITESLSTAPNTDALCQTDEEMPA